MIFILTLFIKAEVTRSLPKLLRLLTIGEISEVVLTLYGMLGEVTLCVVALLRRLNINLDSPRLFLACLALTVILGTKSSLDGVLSLHHARVYHLNVLREL